MVANKHSIYLTKNYALRGDDAPSTNVFVFNENGPLVTTEWAKRQIEMNNGCFIVMDHNDAIRKATEKGLEKRNYYIEAVDFSNMVDGLSVNPFDLVSDTSEIHFMFLNLLYAMWDNSDPDITAMSNLIDAFASCVFFMFSNQKEKKNIETLRKMIYSVRATCQTENGVEPLADVIFASIKDQQSMPCKYYAQFKKAVGDREEEVAEKVAKVFDMLTESDMLMMAETDENLIDAFNFKTAVFVNINHPSEEHSAKLMIILLNYLVQRLANHVNVLLILDNLDAKYNLISLPHWMKEAPDYQMSFLVINNDLAEFKANARVEKYFRNLQKTVSASVLVHSSNAERENAFESEDVGEHSATVLIPHAEISEQDELF